MVMGLEPKETFLEGIRVLSALGTNVVPFVWAPNPGSRLEGHRHLLQNGMLKQF